MDDYGVSQPTQIKYGEVFNTHFPYYLSIGMTEEQYWDGDNLLPRAYRKAEELRHDRQNSYLWLQGKYVYDAIYAMAPALRAMGGGKPESYVNEPYPLTEAAVRERDKREQQRKMEERKAQMLAWMQRVNAAKE